MVFGWQDSSALEEGHAGNDWRDSLPPVTNLRAWYELGLRVANLQYNMANQFGGGCLDPTVPLTIQGKFLVAQMQEIGILVDCGGHTGEQTSLDIIAMARRPVICSHSNVLALNDNPRNTSDRVIEGIAKTGGVFGVTAMDGFMTWSRKDAPLAMTGPYPKTATVSRYVDEFDYLKKLVGIDHIGLGPDFINDLEPIDPSHSVEFPTTMTYAQPKTENNEVGRRFRKRRWFWKRPRRIRSSGLFHCRDRKDLRWQLDARLPGSVERLIARTRKDRSDARGSGTELGELLSCVWH
jgi:membrane dipeptidase